MKKNFMVWICIVLIAALLVGCSGGGNEASGEEGNGGAKRRESVSFATSGQGGTFYVAGSGIASLVSSKVDGLQVTAEVTQGVVENVRLMATGQSEMGFSYGSTAYNMQRGLAEFEGQQYDGLRAVANIHDGALHFVTLERTGIKTLDDLVGKKVSVGPQGSGSAAVAEEFLTGVDLFDAIDIQYLGFNDSASALRDGHIDAFIIGGTTPVPALIELEASHKMTLIPVDEARIQQFLEAHPYHVPYTIAAEAYESISEPVQTVGYTVIWVANEDVPEWVVHEMLQVMFDDEGRNYLQNVQAGFKEMSPGIDRFQHIALPLHPGAEKYYKEEGLM
ncbi:TAXI family TRAP transporter solute-binding subunit [Natronincola ferrireducens]|uniref:TRAP transporter solute receptor, TAXI family n=1 Tax=Natronincola ferrireducens TaxID=393762 RepID=A0A1G9G2D4_9FIRM|nr:TAXI family TRAP transporter solute-binding subunit [Natronincola ferrireducens]SDK94799.1 hypothetical protein SAMN05660472_02327 [Natronincola ferrireducens]